MLKEMYTGIRGENYLSLRKSENNYMEMTFIFFKNYMLDKIEK